MIFGIHKQIDGAGFSLESAREIEMEDGGEANKYALNETIRK